MIKSPLRYPGGKSRAVDFLIKHIKNCDEFREPFVGGGSVFLKVIDENKANKIWINDLNKALMAFWNKAINDNDELTKRVENSYKNKERSLYDIMVKKTNNTEIEDAEKFFVLNRITFSGTTESGGYSKTAHEKRFTISSIEKMKKLKNLKEKNIKITNLDFEEVIKKDGENVFIFLDPPYYRDEKSKLYGKKGNLHKGFDHNRLFSVLKETKHKWIMTYDNSEYIKELYKEFYITEWSLQYGMNNKTSEKNNELLISNFELK